MCRGGLWSLSRSQRAPEDNNHTLCFCRFYLQCLSLSYSCLHRSISLFFILFHHLRHFSGSHSLYISFLHLFQTPFSLFLSSVWHSLTFWCLLVCLSGSLFLLIFSLLSCLTLSSLYSVTFVRRNKMTVWEMEFLAFPSKGFDKKD